MEQACAEDRQPIRSRVEALLLLSHFLAAIAAALSAIAQAVRLSQTGELWSVRMGTADETPRDAEPRRASSYFDN